MVRQAHHERTLNWSRTLHMPWRRDRFVRFLYHSVSFCVIQLWQPKWILDICVVSGRFDPPSAQILTGIVSFCVMDSLLSQSRVLV